MGPTEVAVFQTFREDGALQFDAGLMTMALIGKGTAYTQSRLSGNTNPSSVVVPLPNLTDPIIIAVQATQGVARAGRYVKDGQPVAHYASAAPIGSPVNYWLYGQSNTFPPTGVGLELYNEQGQLTYSSSRPIATIAAVLNGSDQSADLPGGRSYAMAAQEWTGYSQPSGGIYRNGVPYEPGDGTGNQTANWSYNNNGKLFGCMVNGSNVRTGTVTYDDVRVSMGNSRTPLYPDGNRTWTRPMGPVLVLDVTGH